jgi:phage terminase large subunit
MLSLSKTQLVRAAETVIQQHAQARSAPIVLWAGLDESREAFAMRCAAHQNRGAHMILAAVPYGFPVPAGVRPVEFAPKCFRVLHPTRLARFKVLKGGRGSAKSWSIGRALILYSLEEPLAVLCCREVQGSIRASVHKLLVTQIRTLGLSEWFDIDVRAIAGRNGSTFDFEGLFANVDRIKSFEGLRIIWVEEAASITADSWEVLEPTLREEGSFFLINYNPDDANAPTHLMFGDSPRPDALVQHVDYRDNPFLTEPLRLAAEYMRSVDDDAFRHVWLGECRTHSEAQVFRGKFTVEEFTPVRRPQPGDPWSATASKPWDGPYMGADWGFSQDPSTAIKCWIHDKTLYIEHEAYGIGVDIDKTPALFDGIPDARKYLIRADNARPETISYMQQNGYPRVQPCAKWKNCAEDGVAHLRSYEKLIIHPRCEHTAEEFRLFSYKVDRLTGDVLPDLVPKHDHCIDALRYAVEPLIQRRGRARFEKTSFSMQR